MGVFPGPEIAEDGLVLFYDAANASKNASANISTNLITNGNFANGQGSPQESGSNPTNTIIQMANPGDTEWVLRQNGFYTEYQINLTGLAANTTYVMSGWYAKSSDYSVADTMFHARAYSASGANNATGTDIGTVIYSTVVNGVTWQYCYKTITTPADATGYLEWYVGWGVDNAVGFRYYTNLRIEKGTFPSIADLSGNSGTGQAVNGMSFSNANAGSLAFDGVDDYITTPASTPLTFGTGDFTLEVWIRAESFSSYTHMIAMPNQGTFALKANVSNGEIYFYSPTYTTYGSTPSWNLVINAWQQVVFKREASVGYAFLDGQARGSATGFTNNFSANVLNIHNGWGAEFTQCKMSVIRIYNRALSTAEITRNFNATRSRYGL